MSTVEEIESAISRPSREEMRMVRDWLEHMRNPIRKLVGPLGLEPRTKGL
jgi:hypothetical protein